MKPPIHVDLGGADASTARHLGMLTDALLADESNRVLVSFGANQRNAQVTSAFGRWMDRNQCLVRTRVNALAIVIPGAWTRLLWRLSVVLSRPSTPCAVHGTDAKARTWLEQVSEASRRAPASTPR